MDEKIKVGAGSGVKLDQGKIRPSLVLGLMPRAMKAVIEVAEFGARKYSPDGWTKVENGIQRYTDAMNRHHLDEYIEERDRESGLLHAAQVAWNAMVRLELMLRLEDENRQTTAMAKERYGQEIQNERTQF